MGEEHSLRMYPRMGPVTSLTLPYPERLRHCAVWFAQYREYLPPKIKNTILARDIPAFNDDPVNDWLVIKRMFNRCTAPWQHFGIAQYVTDEPNMNIGFWPDLEEIQEFLVEGSCARHPTGVRVHSREEAVKSHEKGPFLLFSKTEVRVWVQEDDRIHLAWSHAGLPTGRLKHE